MAVILSYECSVDEIPAKVQLGFLTFKTRVYIPLVTRCYKCQKYGHIAAKRRKEEPTCSVCAGPHVYADCHSKDKKCANCRAAHSTSYWQCPRYILAKKVTYRAATEHISYRDAVLQLCHEERVLKSNTDIVANITDKASEATGSRQTRSNQKKQMGSSTTQAGKTNQRNTVTKGIQYNAANAEPTLTTTTAEETVSKHNTDYFTDTLSGEALYKLLAMFLKLHEEHTSQPDLTACILKYLSSKLNHPGDWIEKGILQCHDSTSQCTPMKILVASTSRSSKIESRGIGAHQNSSSNSVTAPWLLLCNGTPVVLSPENQNWNGFCQV